VEGGGGAHGAETEDDGVVVTRHDGVDCRRRVRGASIYLLWDKGVEERVVGHFDCGAGFQACTKG
jgi:hypothetical protein